MRFFIHSAFHLQFTKGTFIICRKQLALSALTCRFRPLNHGKYHVDYSAMYRDDMMI